jgi:hypothetical protein
MRVTINQNIKQYNVNVNQQSRNFRVQIKQKNLQNRVIVSSLGKRGLNGKSAYEIAVQNGFLGTEQEYVRLSIGVLKRESGEPIPSYTPVVILENKAYKLDASNPLHQFAFAGFSKNGTLSGDICEIQERGEIELSNWGLTPNKQYLAGVNGTLILTNNSNLNFTKILGFATSTNKLLIIKDYTTINKF